MIVKFPCMENIEGLLATFRHNIVEVCYPKKKSNHAFCYVRLRENEKERFFKHFAVDENKVTILADDSEEIPSAIGNDEGDLYYCVARDDKGPSYGS